MYGLFISVLNVSFAASFLIIAIFLSRLALKRAPRYIHVLIWSLVAIRLLLPVQMESDFSLLPSRESIPETITTDKYPAINSGLSVVDDLVNPFLTESFAPNEADSANPMQIVIEVGLRIWIAGMTVMLEYLLLSYLLLRRSMREAVQKEGTVFLCDRAQTPFILGVIKPRIYLPSDISDTDYEPVVAHERAHIRRLDHLWKPLAYLVLTVYWFNPLVWVAYFLLSADIELACDEKVMKDCTTEQMAAYSQALLNVGTRKRTGFCPLAFGDVGVKTRVKAIVNYKKPTAIIIVVSLLIVALLFASFLTYPKAHAREPEMGIYYCGDVICFSMLSPHIPDTKDIPFIAFTETGTMMVASDDISVGAYSPVGALNRIYIGKREFMDKFSSAMSWRDGYSAESIFDEATHFCRLKSDTNELFNNIYLLYGEPGTVYLASLTPNDNVWVLYKLVRSEPLPTFLYTAEFNGENSDGDVQTLLLDTEKRIASLTFAGRANYEARGRYYIENDLLHFTTDDAFSLHFVFMISDGQLIFLEQESDLKNFNTIMDESLSFSRRYSITRSGSSAFFDVDKDGITELIFVQYNEDKTLYTFLIKNHKMIYEGYLDFGEYSSVALVTNLDGLRLVCNKNDKDLTVDRYKITAVDGKPIFTLVD